LNKPSFHATIAKITIYLEFVIYVNEETRGRYRYITKTTKKYSSFGPVGRTDCKKISKSNSTQEVKEYYGKRIIKQ
jgi:hypothetical protein